MKEHDPVSRPAHYNFVDDPTYEPIKVIEAWQADFHTGNTIKYIARAGKKDPAKLLEDLKKAAWYLDRKIYCLENNIDIVEEHPPKEAIVPSPACPVCTSVDVKFVIGLRDRLRRWRHDGSDWTWSTLVRMIDEAAQWFTEFLQHRKKPTHLQINSTYGSVFIQVRAGLQLDQETLELILSDALKVAPTAAEFVRETDNGQGRR